MKTETLEYLDGNTKCQGILVHGEGRTNGAGVLFAPDIRGVGLRPQAHLDLLTAQGYLVLVVDMYGDGINMRDLEHGRQLGAAVRSSQDGWRNRIRAAFDALKAQPSLDATRIGAVGYCFGGGTVLQLALSGAEVAATVVMHGTLDGVGLEDVAQIKGRILFCTGAEDPMFPAEKAAAMQTALRAGGVQDWEMITFGRTKHSFTNVAAPNNEVLAYSKIADQRSQAAMLGLFKEAMG